MFKRCFSCGRNYPLIMFYKNNRKYQREDMKKRVHCCRICCSNNLIRTGKHLKLHNDKTFEIVIVKPNLINWIKKFLNKI